MPLWDPLKYPPLSLQCSGQIYFPLTLTPGILGWLGMPTFPTCCKAKRLCSKSPVASRLRFSLARDYIYAGIFLVCANIQLPKQDDLRQRKRFQHSIFLWLCSHRWLHLPTSSRHYCYPILLQGWAVPSLCGVFPGMRGTRRNPVALNVFLLQ